VEVRKTSPPAVVYRNGPHQFEDDDESLPGSWPKQEMTSPINSLAVEADGSDAASMVSNHVNDQIAVQIAQIEKEQHSSPSEGLGFQGLSTYRSQESMYIAHTELTPIMEVSPPGSLASDAADVFVAGRLPSLSPDSDVKEAHASPPPTRDSHSSSAKGPASPQSSTHSNDRVRTSSLTSQAERLRNKFLNRKNATDVDLTVDTLAANPAKVERRMKFESLIRSGETMKMTLTPTSLRSIEVL
jgi:hypothetical protein